MRIGFFSSRFALRGRFVWSFGALKALLYTRVFWLHFLKTVPNSVTANRFNLHARQNFFFGVAHRRPIVLKLSTLQSPRQRHLLRRSVVHIRSVLTESGLFWTQIFSPCVAHRFPLAFSFGACATPPQGGSHRDFIRCNPFRNTQAGSAAMKKNASYLSVTKWWSIWSCF